MMDTVWIVEYWDVGEKVNLAVFNNKQGAEKYFAFLLGDYDHVDYNPYKIYSDVIMGAPDWGKKEDNT